jgi:ribosomal protein S18 acetylase RimI-like enzyme
MDITIRPAAEADFDAIRRNTVEAYAEAGFIDDEYAYNHILAGVEESEKYAALLVAEQDGKIVGSVFVTQAGGEYSDVAHDGELEFRMLAVVPEAQRRGTGRRLVEAVIERARQDPETTAVVLTTGPRMTRQHSLYESLGFERIPERDFLLTDDFALHLYKLAL